MEKQASQYDRQKALAYACQLIVNERKGHYHTFIHLLEAGLSSKEAKEIIREAEKLKNKKTDLKILIGACVFFLGLTIMISSLLFDQQANDLMISAIFLITGILLIYFSSN